MKHTILTIFAITTTAYSGISDGLVAHYLFDGNATDQTGNGYNGTVNGAQLTLDRFGNLSSAYSFNGTSNYIIVNQLLPDSQGFTISAWIRPETLKAAGIFYDSALFTPGRDTTFQTLADGSLQTQFTKISDPGPTNALTSAVLSQGLWTHVVATTEPTGTAIYINGSSVATQVAGSNNIGYHSNPYIGAENHGFYVQDFFHGDMDDIRVYDRALSAGDVSTLFQIEAVPEPGTALVGLALCGLALGRRRRGPAR
jgi:hypothetical protein